LTTWPSAAPSNAKSRNKTQTKPAATKKPAKAGFFNEHNQELLLVIGHTVQDFFVGRLNAFPALDLDPLAFFKVFVVLKEVGDLLQLQLMDISQ
jgi:hypothetical protein